MKSSIQKACPYRKLDPSDRTRRISYFAASMVEWVRRLAYALSLRFKSRARLEAENLVLRQQLTVVLRKLPKRVRLTNSDRLPLAWPYRLFPSILSAIRIVKPATVVRWHRRGFRAYWRWKSRPGVGRPPINSEIRDLIREMSMANPLWGAPRIHGELLMLGIPAQMTLYTARVHRRDGCDMRLFDDMRPPIANRAALVDGTPGVDIYPEVAPAPGEHVVSSIARVGKS
jgi:hypothetical protein